MFVATNAIVFAVASKYILARATLICRTIIKFDESDPILGSNRGELSCIFALIIGDNVEFNLRADHGLHELIRDWLLDSTAPVFVNKC